MRKRLKTSIFNLLAKAQISFMHSNVTHGGQDGYALLRTIPPACSH